jgi:hypothetical protein
MALDTNLRLALGEHSGDFLSGVLNWNGVGARNEIVSSVRRPIQ